MFNPSRLTFARRRRGLTKKGLAALVQLSSRSILAYEAGSQEPTEQSVRLLAEKLGFPLEFFLADDLDEVSSESASFRALSRMTASQRNAALAAGALAISLGRLLERRFQLPDPNVPDLLDVGGPEAAAAALRSSWGLGERPVGNMIHLLEAKGVRVFSLVEDCREVDAFSLWDQSKPYIFLNTFKSAERSRFDAAHELGHLVMHRHGAPQGRSAEEEANTFASSFLMPRGATIARAPLNPTIRSIVEGKEAWGVSAVAYAYRLHQLELLSDWYYEQLIRKMTALGFRTAEPNPRPRETSQVLRKVFEQLRGTGTSKADIARELAVYPSELDKLVFGLVMTGVDGGSNDTLSTQRPALRLVN